MPLVFVHGWAGSSGVWRSVIDALPHDSPFGEVIALDLPGSPRAPGGLGGATIPEAARVLVDTLRGFSEPAIVVGHSMGAQITLAAQALAPEAIHSEVVLDPAYGGGEHDRAELAGWVDRIRTDGHAGLEDFFREALGPEVPDHDRQAVLHDFRATKLDVILSYLESEYLADDAIGLFPQTARAAAQRTRPVLSLYIRSASLGLTQSLPAPTGSIDELWPGSHFFHLEDPHRFVERLIAWAQVSRGSELSTQSTSSGLEPPLGLGHRAIE